MICIKCGETYAATQRNVVCPSCRNQHLESLGYLNGAQNITDDEAIKAREKIKVELDCFDLLIAGKSLAEIAEHSGMTKQQLSVFFRRKINNLYPRESTEPRVNKVFAIALTWPESLYAAVFKRKIYENMPEDAEETINALLSALPEREQAVLLYRYKDGLVLEEIAGIDGVTRERIRQIEANALRKLRHSSKLSCLELGLRETQKLQEIDREVKNRIQAEQEKKAREEAIAKYEAILTRKTALSDISIEILGISVRCFNALARSGVTTLADIEDRKDEIRRFKNLGPATYEELRRKCTEYCIFLP